jgi:hypothetical protein
VEYLIASTCHQAVFDHLEGYNVNLWHVFDNDTEAMRVLPAGEWALTGGCDVGLRAMTIARFFGFTDLHIFGMDGSSATSTSRHADHHPNSHQKMSEIECNGRTFNTTPGMLAAAQGIWHELDMMPDVVTHFYGDGLIQEMSKSYTRKPITKPTALIGFRKPELISEEYVRLNAQLHRENVAYGIGGSRHADTVIKLRSAIKADSVLDYGSGKGYLQKELPFPIWQYDPAMPEFSESPRPADLVVCTDVLEHIEPDKLDYVLDDLRRCVKKVGYFVIHTQPSTKSLADGRNSHLIQKGQKWWGKKLAKFFTIGKIAQSGPNVVVVVGPRVAKKGEVSS